MTETARMPEAALMLERVPRFTLARLPTPLHEAKRLRAALGGELSCPRILLKRDDLTDLALGGNKARKLEFLVADALRNGATALVTTGAIGSNHARMTAAAARLAGLRAALVLSSREPSPKVQGNLLLDRILGASVHIIEGGDDAVAAAREAAKIDEVMAGLERSGERPCLIPVGGSNAIGTLGYVAATCELAIQLVQMGIAPTHLYYASGSRGTQAGLELGARIFDVSWRCTGIAVSGGELEKRERAVRIANEAAEKIGAGVRLEAGELNTEQQYYGPGYAIPTDAGLEAMRMLAATEGVFLDPVYTGKAMAGLIDHIRNGALAPDDVVIFLHTGGAPGLFGQADVIAPLLQTG